ncbi:MAG: hypothetical protein ABI689_05315 [Thermoanaerobaculia bacterium]
MLKPLTLVGHEMTIVVMTQMEFTGGVSETQQAKAVELTEETFALDTGGGCRRPQSRTSQRVSQYLSGEANR